MRQNNSFVELHHLSKSVKGKQLLYPLSHELAKGTILAICGGNGAGKSTLIRMITGLIKPTTGQVRINGIKNHKIKHDYAEQFGYMPDDFQFQKSMTAKETIQFYAQLKRVPAATYYEILQEVGLADKLNERVGNFSKGMNQRLLLAQTLLATPELLVLDEPTNGLDPYWVKRFNDIMLSCRNAGQTIIFSTHDLHVAEKIADEVIFLSDGKVISQGSIEKYRGVGLYQTFQQLYFEINHE